MNNIFADAPIRYHRVKPIGRKRSIRVKGDNREESLIIRHYECNDEGDIDITFADFTKVIQALFNSRYGISIDHDMSIDRVCKLVSDWFDSIRVIAVIQEGDKERGLYLMPIDDQVILMDNTSITIYGYIDITSFKEWMEKYKAWYIPYNCWDITDCTLSMIFKYALSAFLNPQRRVRSSRPLAGLLEIDDVVIKGYISSGNTLQLPSSYPVDIELSHYYIEVYDSVTGDDSIAGVYKIPQCSTEKKMF